MDLGEYKAQAMQVPMFEELAEDTRESVCRILLQIATRTDLAAGGVLYAKGEEEKGTGALLVAGALLVGAGAAGPLTINAPDILGEMQQFDEYGQRAADVTAAEDAVVLEFPWEDFVGVALSVLSQEAQIEVKAMFSRNSRARRAALDKLGGGGPGA